MLIPLRLEQVYSSCPYLVFVPQPWHLTNVVFPSKPGYSQVVQWQQLFAGLKPPKSDYVFREVALAGRQRWMAIINRGIGPGRSIFKRLGKTLKKKKNSETQGYQWLNIAASKVSRVKVEEMMQGEGQDVGAPSCSTANLSRRHSVLYDGCKSSLRFSIFSYYKSWTQGERKEKGRRRRESEDVVSLVSWAMKAQQ